ncbi:TATA-binding protein-associated factor [Paragonimus westermani]|uniref:TATA-binding protein-associated factor n=1 Tax=Paragonimus westermani TaxID=34504 RepID=A0A5J4N6X2_9TREM|nr:TATA-binding protein-associated factor [Paragonimus westermani]
MTRTLSVDRLKKRHFIDSLLHPKKILAYNLPVPINARLRGYQQEGLNWLNFLNQYGLNGILCDDLGLGKTLQTICILAGSHHERKTAQNLTTHDTSALNGVNSDSPALPHPISLVVCPSTLCGHWLHEVNQFVNSDHLSPIIYVGGPSVRRSLQSQIPQFDLVIASYDVVRNDIEFFQSIFWHYVVLDEGHIIKSSKSKVSRALKKLCAQHRLILTGTPIQNRICELWSLFDFLMPDFLGTESEFAGKFARPVAASRDPKASKSEQRAGQKALENLHRLVLPFMMRRLKEDVVADLPPKIVQDFACELTNVQMQLYEAFTKSAEGQRLLTSIETDSSHSSANRTASNSSNLPVTYGARFGEKRYGFQALRYLQAVCNHPCLALKPSHPLFADMKHVVQSEFGPNVSLDSVHLSGKLLSLW